MADEQTYEPPAEVAPLPDPRNEQWHYTDLPYICGAPTPAGPCYAEAPSADGACSRHAEVSR